MNQRKQKKIILVLGVVFLLVFSFWYGGNSDGLHGFSVSDQNIEESVEITETDESSNGDIVQGKSEILQEQETSEENNIFQQIIMHIKKKDTANTSKNTQNNKKAQKNATKAAKKSNSKKKKQIASTAGKKTVSNNSNQPGNNTNTPSAPSDITTQTESQDAEDSGNIDSDNNEDNHTNTTEIAVTNGSVSTEETKSGAITCTIYISCATLLDHMDGIKSESKKKLVPKDGVILKTTSVNVKEGSTVFDVLKNITRAENIHLEYSFTPMFKSYYIEGIYNLYEFDGGDLSGWMYNVNGEFPAYGCSEYIVKDGDEIKWLYTCDLGRDVGCYFLK